MRRLEAKVVSYALYISTIVLMAASKKADRFGSPPLSGFECQNRPEFHENDRLCQELWKLAIAELTEHEIPLECLDQ